MLTAAQRLRLKNHVAWYVRDRRPKEEEIFKWYASSRSLQEAITRAAFALLPDGSRHPHQHRRRHAAMEAAKQDLMLNIKTVRSAKDFEDLHNRIARIVGHISDIGELYVYDTTTRIGAFLGLYPESVYLHSGTRAGAALLGLSIQREHIPPEEMPEEMRTLKIYEMEDVLCHCTHLLAKTERVQKTPDC